MSAVSERTSAPINTDLPYGAAAIRSAKVPLPMQYRLRKHFYKQKLSITDNFYAVSYTHLDVYKRQPPVPLIDVFPYPSAAASFLNSHIPSEDVLCQCCLLYTSIRVLYQSIQIIYRKLFILQSCYDFFLRAVDGRKHL